MDIRKILAETKPKAAEQYDEIAYLIGPPYKDDLDSLLKAVWFAAVDAVDERRTSR